MAYQRGKYRGGVNVNAGLDAFDKAYGLTKGVMEDYRRSKADAEVDTLGSNAAVTEGKGLTVTDANGNVSRAVIDESAGADLDTIRKQYEEAGYTVKLDDKAYAARAGEGKDYGVYDTEREADIGSRKANTGLMRQQADVYQKHGLRKDAAGLRKEAREGERQDMADQMKQETHTQQIKLGQLQVGEAEAQAASRKRIEGFNTAFAEAEAAGKIKTIGDIRALASQHGLSPQEQFQLATAKVGLDEAQTKSDTMARIRLFNETWQKGGIKGVNELYDTHPLFANGRNMDVVPTKGGIRIVDGGREIFSGTEAEAMGFLHEALVDPIKAVSFARDVEKFKLDQRKGEAQIRESEAGVAAKYANAAESRAKGDYYRGQASGAGGTGAYKEPTPQMLEYAAEEGAALGWDQKKVSRAVAMANQKAAEAGVPFSIAWSEIVSGPRGQKPAPAESAPPQGLSRAPQRAAPAEPVAPEPPPYDPEAKWREGALSSMGVKPDESKRYRKLDPRSPRF